MGAFFDHGMTRVVLIRKKRPQRQAGRWNLVGGHIEEGESSLEAMRREFREEVGLDQQDWKYVGQIDNQGHYTVDIFGTEALEGIPDVKATTDEIPSYLLVSSLPYDVLPNLNWIVPFVKNFLQQDADRPLHDRLVFGQFDYSF